MANLNDPKTSKAILTAIGTNTNFEVGASATTKDLFSEHLSDHGHPQRRFLVCTPLIKAEVIASFARSIGNLVHAQIEYLKFAENRRKNFDLLTVEVSRGCDLVLFTPEDDPFGKCFFSLPTSEKILEKLHTSLLIVREPRWPLSRILLVFRGDEKDDPAIDWVLHLALASNAAVTVLVNVPEVPGMYRGLERFNIGLPEILATDTPFSNRLRQAAERLVKGNIKGTFRLRQGSPIWQYRCELAEENYDLVIIGADPYQWFLRFAAGGLASPLVRWVERPILIAKSMAVKDRT